MAITEPEDVGELVQASESETLPDASTRPRRSPTEQARFVAGYFGWSLNGDAIEGPDDPVALSVEELAAAMTELGWLTDDGIEWDAMPFAEHEAVEALLAVQRAHGWDV